MQRMLERGDCVDVSACQRTATGDYVLEAFVDGVDYCDAVAEVWIWSIGRTLRPLPAVLADGSRLVLPAGTYLASRSNHLYSSGESETIKCVFLR